MQIGCGVYEHTVRGRTYLYFWHYETTRGHRHQVKDYLGPSHSRDAREEALRRSEAYFRRARQEIDRMRATMAAILRARKP